MPPESEESPVGNALRAIVRVTPALAAMLLLASCGVPPSSEVLNSRVARRMAPDQPCNTQASVEYQPSGARISMPDSALFTVGRVELSACGRFAMASVVEAMLDPHIMQVVIEPGGDIQEPYAGLVRQRADALKAMFTNVGFVRFQPPVLVQSRSTSPIGVWGVVLMVGSRS